ncbi:MAG: carboxymuconolactone decarboxylase family protein, partial [Gammaproteobacteria bacterium]
MSRIEILSRDNAPAASQVLLDQIQGAFGATPNMFGAVANSPAALASMWGAFGALGGGLLDARLGEQIAVAIADLNDCEYCLAAHTALGRKAGASSEEMAAAQAGQSADPKTAAALRFATRVVRQRAKIAD